MRRDVTDKFLEVTMDAYMKRFGASAGKSLLGVFTDEPHIRLHQGPYTPALFETFKKRWGYDLREHLASLFVKVGDWKRVRHNYFEVLNELFIGNWAKPYYEYCEKHNLELTGHFWEHDWPTALHSPETMALYAWQQRPALDCLMNNYSEDLRGQFGNSRITRELSSVANQLGRKRTLCEAFGAAGWEFRFEDQKRIADWLAVFGVNTINQHLSYVTIRGARKRDHPQSFSYHAPYWKEYHHLADYLARLSAVAAQGDNTNSVLLLQPTTTGWFYQNDSDKDTLTSVGQAFQDTHLLLERGNVEYDIGSEYMMANWGGVDGKILKVGQRSYHSVVITPQTENLNKTTFQLLKQFSDAGGKVIHG